MGTVSMNNLWSFIQGLSLTASDRRWLASKLLEPSGSDMIPSNDTATDIEGYIISPKRRKLMGSVTIDPKDIESDDKLKYILSK
jgi:hypothetical protein